MQRIVSLLITAMLLCSIISGQRRLEVLADAGDSDASTVALNGTVVIAHNGDSFLKVYNDDRLATHNLPIVRGTRLEFSRQIGLFRSEASMILWREGVGYLYLFNGADFRNIFVPGRIVSTCITFGDNLYVLSQVESDVKLFRYDGSIVSEVSELPVTRNYKLIAANNYLYLFGYSDRTSDPPDIVKRYNGTTTTTLPYFRVQPDMQILPVGETERVYFVDTRIVYFDGSAVSEIFDVLAGSITGSNDGVIWGNELYFISFDGIITKLYKAEGTIVTEIMPPAGSGFYRGCNPIVYNDTLFTQIRHSDGSSEILKYDGISFSTFLTLPEPRFSSGRLYIREGNLIIHPNFANANNAFEYNGARIIEILAPASYTLRHYLNSSECHFLWMSVTDGGWEDPLNWTFLKESKGCLLPLPTPVMPIPEYLLDYEKIDLRYVAYASKWIWSAMSMDWVINRECPDSPCEDPVFNVAFIDKGGKTAWQQKFDQAFDVKIPLKDDQPYKSSLSVIDKNSIQPLIIMSEDLVPKGISGIRLSMKPTKGHFKLSVQTVKGISVPIKASLLNKDGKSIWEKVFIAPVTTQINDEIKEPGQVLYFSIAGSSQQIVNDPGITAVNFYPNPSRGQLNLEVKTSGKIIDTEVTITSFNGEILLRKTLQAPFRQILNLPPLKAGFYVLKLKTDEEEISKLIQVE